jgi:hypothetical protein
MPTCSFRLHVFVTPQLDYGSRKGVDAAEMGHGNLRNEMSRATEKAKGGVGLDTTIW